MAPKQTSCPSTYADVKKRRKLRTAVKKTNNKTTIALIERNHAQSSLLALPSEIRQTILMMVLGGRSIHILLRHDDDSVSINGDWGFDRFGDHKYHKGQLYNHICHTKPDEPFRQETSALASGKDVVIYSAAYHFDCIKPLGQRIRLGGAPPFGYERKYFGPSSITQRTLSIMAAGRQLYEEAHSVFWASNAFVFTDAFSLPAFLARLNTAQKNKIAILHMSICLDWITVPPTNVRGIDLVTVRSLKNIEKLALAVKLENLAEEDLADAWRLRLSRVHALQDLNPRRLAIRFIETPLRFGRDIASKLGEGELRGVASEFAEGIMDKNKATEMKAVRVAKRQEQLRLKKLKDEEKATTRSADSFDFGGEEGNSVTDGQ